MLKQNNRLLLKVMPLLVLGAMLFIGNASAAGMMDTGEDTWLYLPLVSHAPAITTHETLMRPNSVYLARSASNFADAFNGPVELRHQDLTTGAWNIPPNHYASDYEIVRGYFSYDLGDLADRTVISAVLEVHLCTAQMPPQEATTMTLHAGTWTGEITADTWDKIGDPMGDVTIPPTYRLPEEAQMISLPLSGTLPDRLRFVWQADESQAYPFNTTVGATFDLADCYGVGLEDEQLTQLHLWVREP
jgi:hypothetical protein